MQAMDEWDLQLFKRRENMNMLYILIPLLKRYSSCLVGESLAQ